MTDRVHHHADLIFSVGTQVVTLVDIPGSAGLVLHARGKVGVVVKSPTDREHSYRVRFPDGVEAPLKRSEVTMLAQFKEGEIGDSAHAVAHADLYQRVIYRLHASPVELNADLVEVHAIHIRFAANT